MLENLTIYTLWFGVIAVIFWPRPRRIESTKYWLTIRRLTVDQEVEGELHAELSRRRRVVRFNALVVLGLSPLYAWIAPWPLVVVTGAGVAGLLFELRRGSFASGGGSGRGALIVPRTPELYRHRFGFRLGLASAIAASLAPPLFDRWLKANNVGLPPQVFEASRPGPMGPLPTEVPLELLWYVVPIILLLCLVHFGTARIALRRQSPDEVAAVMVDDHLRADAARHLTQCAITACLATLGFQAVGILRVLVIDGSWQIDAITTVATALCAYGFVGAFVFWLAMGGTATIVDRLRRRPASSVPA